MFITRKEYNRALERAKREARDRLNTDYYIQQRLDDMARDMNRRMERMEEDIARLKGNQANFLNSVG